MSSSKEFWESAALSYIKGWAANKYHATTSEHQSENGSATAAMFADKLLEERNKRFPPVHIK